jgi:hypothetical protein
MRKKAGVWFFENRPTASIDTFYVGELEVHEHEDGTISVELQDARRHSPKTNFGRLLPKGASSDVLLGEPIGRIKFERLNRTSSSGSMVYHTTECGSYKVVIDYRTTQ